MIFYFTGTGNSLYAAARLSHGTADRVVSIAECMQKEEFAFPEPCERAGFVFPVYWYGIPAIVERFLDRLTLGGCDYAYAVITCGGSAGGTLDALRARLRPRGVMLSAAFSVRMPDNYILLFAPPKAEKRAAMLAEADRRLDKITAAVVEKQSWFDVAAGAVKPLSGLLHRYYETHRSVKKFRPTTDARAADAVCLSAPRGRFRSYPAARSGMGSVRAVWPASTAARPAPFSMDAERKSGSGMSTRR